MLPYSLKDNQSDDNEFEYLISAKIIVFKVMQE